MEERVAGTVDLQGGEMMAVLVGGKKVLLARVDGSFHATAARCSHWGGPLPEGTLHAPRLLCPWHKATFDVRSGDLLEPPALDGIAAFRVRVDGIAQGPMQHGMDVVHGVGGETARTMHTTVGCKYSIMSLRTSIAGTASA